MSFRRVQNRPIEESSAPWQLSGRGLDERPGEANIELEERQQGGLSSVTGQPSEPSDDRSDSQQTPPVLKAQNVNETSSPAYQSRMRDVAGPGTTFGETEETDRFLSDNYPESTSTSTSNGPTSKKKGKSHELLLKTWWIEIVSLLIATAALIAIVVTLAKYDGQEQPAWSYAINLNTLIAILATLLRACMVIVAEEAMSQLKWMLFRQPQPVQYLGHFDTATRGPWGSLLLLFRTRKIDPTLIGCMVVLLSVGVGPFTQQAVKTVSCELPLATAEADIGIARYIGGGNIVRVGAGLYDLDGDTKIAIIDGLASPNTTRFELKPGCSTGNCSFPSYNGVTHSSLGICKKCVDATSWTREVEEPTQQANGTTAKVTISLMLPDNTGIGGNYNDSPPANIMGVSSKSVMRGSNSYPWQGKFLTAFGDASKDIFSSSILNTSVVTLTNDNCGPLGRDGEPLQNCSHDGFDTTHKQFDSVNVAAAACSFYPCIRDYHGSVKNTIFEETILNETPIARLSVQKNALISFIQLHTPCIIEGKAYTANNISSAPRDSKDLDSGIVGNEHVGLPTQCLYGMYGDYISSLADFMQGTLNGGCRVPNTYTFGGRTDDYKRARCTPWYLQSLLDSGNASFQSIDAGLQSVALAITSEIRKQGTGLENYLDGSSERNPQLYAKGSVVRTTVCTRFDWKWLAFPLALVTLTIFLLCITCARMMLDKQRVPAWKSSILPMLLTGNQIGSTIVAGDLKSIVADTNRVVVRLAYDGKGWEFIREETSKQAGGSDN